MAYYTFNTYDPMGYWFGSPNQSLSNPRNQAGAPFWSTFGLGPALYGPMDARVPSYVRDPLARLVYMLPRWNYAGRAMEIGRAQYSAAAGDPAAGGSYGTSVIDLPVLQPTGLKNKQLKKWKKQHYFDLPTTISVPLYGTQKPLLRGSRDDPSGVVGPPFRFRWGSSLIA